jgi:hypothetical protein
MPAKTDHRPVFRPGIPCEKQQVADLNAPTGLPDEVANPQPKVTAADRKRMATAHAELEKFKDWMAASVKGKKAYNPLDKVNENFARISRIAADKLLKIPMEAQAVRQWGKKADVAAKYKKEFGAK